jgi:hypothetical protein
MGTNVLWELTKLRRHMGGTTGVAFYVLGVVVLGIAVPSYLRFEFLEVPALVIYACLPWLLVPPVVAESIASESEREFKPTEPGQRRDWLYGKVGAAVVYGWLSAMLILVLALMSLRLWAGRFLAPPMLVAVGLVLISMASAMFAASFAAAVSIGARSARGVKRGMRQGLLLLVVIFLYLSRQPWGWKRRFAVPETSRSFLELALVISIVLVGVSVGLVRLALHASEPAEIRLNL